jgi:hypothetical protein
MARGFQTLEPGWIAQVPATDLDWSLSAQLGQRQISGDGQPWRERPPRWPRAWQRERPEHVVAHATVPAWAGTVRWLRQGARHRAPRVWRPGNHLHDSGLAAAVIALALS